MYLRREDTSAQTPPYLRREDTSAQTPLFLRRKSETSAQTPLSSLRKRVKPLRRLSSLLWEIRHNEAHSPLSFPFHCWTDSPASLFPVSLLDIVLSVPGLIEDYGPFLTSGLFPVSLLDVPVSPLFYTVLHLSSLRDRSGYPARINLSKGVGNDRELTEDNGE